MGSEEQVVPRDLRKKLSDDDREYIRTSDKKNSELATIFEVSSSLVRFIKNPELLAKNRAQYKANHFVTAAERERQYNHVRKSRLRKKQLRREEKLNHDS